MHLASHQTSSSHKQYKHVPYAFSNVNNTEGPAAQAHQVQMMKSPSSLERFSLSTKTNSDLVSKITAIVLRNRGTGRMTRNSASRHVKLTRARFVPRCMATSSIHVNSTFLSDFASCLLLEVPRRTILHKDVLYHDTFTGKQFIVRIHSRSGLSSSLNH